MQLHYYIDTTPNFCTTLTKPDKVNYVYTYLHVYHYCYYTDQGRMQAFSGAGAQI